MPGRHRGRLLLKRPNAALNLVHSLWASIQGDPRYMRKLHGYLTLIWFVAAFPIMVFWHDNVPFLVFVSVYAVVTGQAARVEEKQDATSSS